MRVFYDTEFVERGPGIPIQPVSLGFVAEDGRELYVINEECLSAVLRHPWLSVNVASHLPIQTDIGGPNFIAQWDRDHEEYQHVLALDTLTTYVRGFLMATPDLELWADYGAYDHVVLCQLFGSMNELPAGIPMWTHDIQQLRENYPLLKLPPDPAVPHHALWDARWAADAYQAYDLQTRAA